MIERRFSSAALRAINPIENSSNSPGTVTGYSAKYSNGPVHNLSENLGGFRERLAPGCFDKSLRGNNMDFRCDFNHDNNYPLGRTANGTLSLRSDSTGLLMRCVFPNTSYARDLLESIKRGDISGQSFGFTCDGDDWSNEDDPDNPGTLLPVRTVRSARLQSVSIVTQPAYANTSVAADRGDGPAHDAALVMGRSHSFDSLFPEGIPAEIRSRIPDARQRFDFQRDRRRRLTDRVLSI